MLKFFRHIRRSLVEHLPAGQEGSSLRRYLLYAFGEIFLVVVGILIALQVNNWNEERKERVQEKNYVQLLYRDLKADSVNLDQLIRSSDEVVRSKEILLSYNGDQQNRPDSLARHFLHAAFTAFSQFIPNDGAIEEIQNAGGTSLIKNEALRTKVLELYNSYDIMDRNVGQYHLSNTLEIRERVYEKANGELFLNGSNSELDEGIMHRLATDSDIRNRVINNWAVTYNTNLKELAETNALTMKLCKKYLNTLGGDLN